MKTFTPQTSNHYPFAPGAQLFDDARHYLDEPLVVLAQEARARSKDWPATGRHGPICYLDIGTVHGAATVRLTYRLADLLHSIRAPWFVRRVGESIETVIRDAGEHGGLVYRFGIEGEPPVAQLVMPPQP